MKLTPVPDSDTPKKTDFTYDKVPGAEGYIYYKDDQRVARTFNPDDTTVTFGKPFNSVKVEAVNFGVLAHAEWPASVPPGPAEPPAIAGGGYRVVFEDQFATLDIGDNNKWYPKEFWQGAPPAGAITNPNGNLLMSSKRKDGYPNITVTTLKKDISKATVFRDPCYAESRFRWTAGAGAFPGFWLFSHAHAMGVRPPLCSEFDIFEGQGTRPKEFSGALHEDTATAGHAFKGCWTEPPGEPDLSTWHVFAGLWLKDKVSWYVDDNKLCEQPTYVSSDQPMYLLYSMWIGGWTPGNQTGPTTPDSLDLEVDWVRIWQK